MLILLPPSEGKLVPRRGNRLDLAHLDFAELTDARHRVLTALIDLCSQDPSHPSRDEVLVERAAAVLGLGRTQTDEVQLNARLLAAPTTRADRLYTGVLYDALDLGSLDGPARRRATRWLAITSSLFGLVRTSDALPAYRLSGNVSLPGLGTIASHWRQHLDPVIRDAIGSGLLIDLRSSTYAGFWRPGADLADRVATVRVLHQVGRQRKVVSHFNKATKGRLVRDLLTDGRAARAPSELADQLDGLGWAVEVHPPTRYGHQLDVIVSEL